MPCQRAVPISVVGHLVSRSPEHAATIHVRAAAKMTVRRSPWAEASGACIDPPGTRATRRAPLSITRPPSPTFHEPVKSRRPLAPRTTSASTHGGTACGQCAWARRATEAGRNSAGCRNDSSECSITLCRGGAPCTPNCGCEPCSGRRAPAPRAAWRTTGVRAAGHAPARAGAGQPSVCTI